MSEGKVKTGILRNINKPKKQTGFLVGAYTSYWSEYSRVPANKDNVFWACVFKTSEGTIGKI